MAWWYTKTNIRNIGTKRVLFSFVTFMDDSVNPPSNRRVVAYNGFPFHHEMIGHVADFCIHRELQLVVYTNFEGHLGWMDLYVRLFEGIRFLPHTEYAYDSDDIVFLLTDDDPTFHPPTWTNVICIDHDRRVRRTEPRHRVATRSYPDTPELRPWVLPVYTMLWPTTRASGVACIGKFSWEWAKKTLQKYTNFGAFRIFVFDRRTNDGDYDDDDRTNVRFDETATDMIQCLLHECQYIAVMAPRYVNDLMSGAIPLAASTGCALLTTPMHAMTYGLQSCVDATALTELLPLTEEHVAKVVEETRGLIRRRNDAYDSLLTLVRSEN